MTYGNYIIIAFIGITRRRLTERTDEGWHVSDEFVSHFRPAFVSGLVQQTSIHAAILPPTN